MALTALRIATALVTACLVALIIYTGQPSDLAWWFLSAPFSAFALGPALLPYVLANKYRERPAFGFILIAFLLLSSAWAGAGYVRAYLAADNSLAWLLLFDAPLPQWVVLLAIWLLLAAIDWLDRPADPAR